MIWVIFAVLAAVALIFGKLKEFLAVCLILAAICFMPGVSSLVGAAFPTLAGVLGAGSWAVAGLALVGAYMMSPETVTEVVENISDAIVAVAEPIIDAGIEVVGAVASAASSLIPAWVKIGALGVAGFWLYGKLSDPDQIEGT